MNIKEIMNHLGAHSPRQRKLVLSRLGNLTHFQHHNFVSDFFGFRYPGHTQNFIDCYVYFLGCYEEGLLSKIKDILSLCPDKAFVDIGANVGHHALYGSLFTKKVYAFEPYGKARERLDEKIALNQISNIEVFPFGLSDKDERLDFYEPSDSNLGTGSFFPKNSEDNTFRSLQLDLKEGSTCFRNNKIENIGLIKIDAEGYEPQILKGLLPILEIERPYIILEYGPLTHQEINRYPEVKSFLINNYHLQLFEDSNRLDYKLLDFNFHLFGDVLLTPLSSQDN